MTLRVGGFFDLRNPAPWRVPWDEHYRRSLELVVELERLGADAVWFSEHHTFDDGYLPQPLTFAAAVAARTSRVRVGTAIVLAALRHPRHVAEEAAIVDLVSGGRLELGLGAGYGRREFLTFDRDISARYRDTDRTVVALRGLLDGGELIPPPLQRPFPIWLGYQGPQGARRAGRLGTGLLTLHRSSLDPYREGLAEGGYDPEAARMGGVVDVIVADDPERTLDRLLPHYAHQLNTYAELHAAGAMAPARDPWTVESLRAEITAPGRVLGLSVCTAAEAVTLIAAKVEGLPVEHVYLWASIAAMPADIAERHAELTFGQVAPALRAKTDRGPAPDPVS